MSCGSRARERERRSEEQDYHQRERTYTRFDRKVLLPASIKAEEARATLHNGVLEITLPKVSVATESE